MSQPRGDALVESLRAELGNGLRAVAEYDRETFELRYLRDDVRDDYPDETQEEVWDDILLQEVAMDRIEQLYVEMGDTRGNIEILEDAAVAHFWPEEAPGVFLTFDRTANPGIYTLERLCTG